MKYVLQEETLNSTTINENSILKSMKVFENEDFENLKHKLVKKNKDSPSAKLEKSSSSLDFNSNDKFLRYQSIEMLESMKKSQNDVNSNK